MADTTNFGWTKPTVGGDPGAWGSILNTLFDDQDTDVQAIKVTADAALSRAGGTMTGPIVNKEDDYVTVDKGSMSGATDLDFAAANYFYGSMTASAVTFTFSNPPASGQAGFFFLEITNGGAASSITWPGSVDWPGGTVPTLQSSGVDVLMFFTRDAGTTWHGSLTNADSQ
jgi:hypothetical protein